MSVDLDIKDSLDRDANHTTSLMASVLDKLIKLERRLSALELAVRRVDERTTGDIVYGTATYPRY